MRVRELFEQEEEQFDDVSLQYRFWLEDAEIYKDMISRQSAYKTAVFQKIEKTLREKGKKDNVNDVEIVNSAEETKVNVDFEDIEPIQAQWSYQEPVGNMLCDLIEESIGHVSDWDIDIFTFDKISPFPVNCHRYIITLKKPTSIKGIEKIIQKVDRIYLHGLDFIANGFIGLCMIPATTAISLTHKTGSPVDDTIRNLNTFLETNRGGSRLDFQEKLIKNGFKRYAR